MLGSGPPRGWAAPPAATIANSSDGATVNMGKAYAPSSRVEKTAAGSPLPLSAITSLGSGAASRGGKDSAVHSSDGAVARGPAPPSPTSPSVSVGLQTAKAAVSGGAFSSSAATSTLPLPRSDEEVTQYVLYDGLPQIGPASRRAQKRQSEAYYQFQHRIHERTESAHALVLSANPLSLSVMASQLRMYRWRVTQAQTLTEATAILQDYVIDTAKHGYRVRRRAPPPSGQSRYAHGRGRAALKRRAQAELERLSGVKPAAENSAGVSIDGARVGRGVSAAPRHPKDRGASDSRSAEVAGEEEEGELDEAAFEDDAESALPPPPPDTLPRLVLVDTFTHEDLGDVARHVRFVDQEHGLEMLLVLLLPGEAGATTASMQGAGCVITPTHQMTMADAYAVGYDLVLARNMDHLLVDFFTREFVSSAGRWRNDVRSKAAVGNYMSLRSVLLGGLDTAALQRLIWDDRIDDTGVLELLGAQSLSTQGGAQRYGAATRHLLLQQGTAAEAEAPAKRYGSGASRSSRGGSGESDADIAQSVNESILVTGVPRLRNRPTSVAHFGVRLPAQQCAVHESLSSFSTKRDVFSSVMAQPAGARQLQRRRQCQVSGAEDLECDADNNEDALEHQQRLLQGALETELGRLLAENEGKQASIDAMQEEVERLQRTVTVLRRHQRGVPSASGDGSNANQISELSESGSMIHLSKQQQIFILKERLEAANDRIVALLRGGRPSGGPPSPRRRGGGRGGGLSRRPRGSSASGGPRSPTKTPSPTAYSAFLTKVTVQEAERMAALDSDANASLDQLELHRQELIAAANNTAGQAAAGQKQRREREAVNQVIHSLQLELQQLQGRLDDTRPGSSRAEAEGCEGLQARMVSRLQSALEVMEAQKVRIRNLEELRQMDQLLYTTFSREGSKGRKKGAGRSTESTSGVSGGSDEADHEHGSSSFSADEEGDAFASARGTARGRRARQARTKGKKAAKSRFGVELVSAGKKGAAGGGGGVAPSKDVTKGGLDAAEDADSDSTQKMDMEEVAARRTEAAVHDAVTSLQRTHRRQLAALVQTCKMQLARVALKLQKPSTTAYTALLQEELSRAQREQRAAWMRLRFTLRDLAPDQYDATLAERASSSAAATPPLISLRVTPTPEPDATDSGADLGARDDANMVPLGAVTDPNVRSTAANIAREYAAYDLRIAYVSSELQRVEQSMMDSPRHLPEFAPAATPAVVDTPPEQQLLSVYQAAKARVQETIDTCGPIQEYLEAVQAELAIEQQLRPWCDVNSAQLFSAASTALVPSTLCLGASMSGSAADYDHTLHSTHSSTVSATADQLVLLADVDASMRDVADVYATMLRALTPKGSRAAMSISTTSSGSISRHHTSPPARVSKKRNSKKRRQSAVSPTQPKPAASQRRFVAKAADMSSSGSPDESDSLLPLRGSAGFTVEEALDALPIQPDDVACYQGQLRSIHISEGVHSAAQQRLYKLILRAYQQHYIHPVHMAAVESALSLPLPGHRGSGSGISSDVSRESSVSASEALVDLMSAQAGAAHAQHREIMALLELIAPTMTQALRTLTKGLQRVQHLLDREDDGAAFAEAFNGTSPPCTSPVFLTAVDAAVLGCVVDELRWREWRHSLLPSKKDGTDSSDPAALPAAGATPSELLTALILERRGRSGGGRSATPTADGGADLEDARTIGHYAAFCAARERAARNAHSNQGSSVPGPGESPSSEAEDLFHLTDAPPMLVVPSNASGISALAATGGDNADVGLTVAHELAALFGKRRRQDAHGDDDKAAALLEEIYLDDGEYGGAGVLGGDSNTEAMRSIRRELEYLQAAKQQRMWELMMRFELQKERCAGQTDGGGRRLVSKLDTAGARGADGRASPPPIDPDRLGFEVKSGSAAWYGMEAAKRVHNILRRRARPDQIIVGGGPHGGSVGIELSRRTAQPGSSTAGSSKTGNFGGAGAAPGCGVLGQEDEGYARSSAEEEALFTLGPYASHQRSGHSTGRATPSTVRLPPLRQHLLSRAQQGRDGLAGHGGNTALMAGVGYLSPRDVLSLNAYGSMAPGGAYDYAGATEPLHAAGSLTEQVLAYREALMRSAGRVVPMPFTTYANGDPYCLPLSTWPASSGKAGAAGSERYDPLGRQLPSPVPLPDLTAWVYGVPEGYASSLLQQQTTGSHQRQNMALFMPRYDCSSLAEVEGRQRACMTSAVPPSLSRGRSFPAGATAAAPTYSTPAALAAQRLQAMLSVSMCDPSVAAVPAATEAATAGSRGALPTTRGRAYPVHSRRSDGAATAQPRSPAPPLTKRALASASAVDAGAGPSSETDRRTAREGEVSEPDYESCVFDEKDLNPLAETLGPAKGSSS